MEKKPWYKSKITLAGIVLVLTAVTDAATGFLSGSGVTPEQIQTIQTAYPQAAEQIKDAVNGNDYFKAIAAVGGFLVSIWRVWFTNTVVENRVW